MHLPDLPGAVLSPGVSEGLAHVIHVYHAKAGMQPGMVVPLYAAATTPFTITMVPINATTGDIDFVTPITFGDLGGSGTRSLIFTFSYERAQPQ
jgi:hypothetical protein